jgi:hypothetical protein
VANPPCVVKRCADRTIVGANSERGQSTTPDLFSRTQDDLLLHASFRGTSHGRARIDDG